MQHLIFIPGQVSLLKTGEHISKRYGDREAVSRVCVCVCSFTSGLAGLREGGGGGEGKGGTAIWFIASSFLQRHRE